MLWTVLISTDETNLETENANSASAKTQNTCQPIFAEQLQKSMDTLLTQIYNDNKSISEESSLSNIGFSRCIRL